MTKPAEVTDFLNRMNHLIDQHDWRTFIDQRIATETDPASRATWRSVRRHLKREGEL